MPLETGMYHFSVKTFFFEFLSFNSLNAVILSLLFMFSFFIFFPCSFFLSIFVYLGRECCCYIINGRSCVICSILFSHLSVSTVSFSQFLFSSSFWFLANTCFIFREADITKERIQKILGSGANVVLTTGGIDDLCLKYFVEAGAMAVRRCNKADLKRISRATGGRHVLKF